MSLVGKPMRTDSFTAQKQKLTYARVLVEVFAANEFKRTVEVEAPDGTCLLQKIEYKWLPSRCSHCLSFGHGVQQCSLPKLSPVNVEDEADNFVLEAGEDESLHSAERLISLPKNAPESASGLAEVLASPQAPPDGVGRDSVGKTGMSCQVDRRSGLPATACSTQPLAEVAAADLEGLEGVEVSPFIVVKRRKQHSKKGKSSSQESDSNLNLMKLRHKLKGKGKAKEGSSKSQKSVRC